MEQYPTFDIDLVYAWVDGNDPRWMAKHDKFSDVKTTVDANCKGRYVDNDELKYSLRTVEKYAPWIRRIFIVTDDQVPDWLDTSNPKIQIVDHTEILPPEALPCFNASVFEHFLHKIPGLSEHFLYSNDDMFFNRPVSPSDFFGSDGMPIIRLKRTYLKGVSTFFKRYLLGKKLSTYKQTIHTSRVLGVQFYGKKIHGKTHHNIDAYLRSDMEQTYIDLKDRIDSTVENHLRNPKDVDRIIYNIGAIARNHGHIEYVGRNTSLRVRLEKSSLFDYLDDYNPMLYCVNDSQYATDADRARGKQFLQERYPEKSSFEK